jgi:hypothetical protein
MALTITGIEIIRINGTTITIITTTTSVTTITTITTIGIDLDPIIIASMGPLP